jgi:hypothetical protein
MRNRAATVVSWLVLLLVVAAVFLLLRTLLFPPGQDQLPLSTATVVTTIRTATPSQPARKPTSALTESKATEIPPEPSPTETALQVPTETPLPTLIPTATPLPPAPPQVVLPYAAQLGSPKYLAAFTHPVQDCTWLGVAGQVFDRNGAGINNIAVFVSAVQEGQPVNQIGVTGEQSPYGPGGYEILLSDYLSQNVQTLQVQLYDLQGQPLSEPVNIGMPTCTENLALLNFQGIYTSQELFIPSVQR